MLVRLGICGRYPSKKTAAPAKQRFPHHWQFSKEHTASTHAYGFPSYVRVWLRYLIMQEVIQNHENVNALNIGQSEARHKIEQA
jgi:hypothetical protein